MLSDRAIITGIRQSDQRQDFPGGLRVPASATIQPVSGVMFVSNALVQGVIVNPTYGASIAINNLAGNIFRINVTDNAAHSLAAPASLLAGQVITVVERNITAGAIAALGFDAVYKTAGAFTAPATATSRSITFFCDGTNWVELYRGAANVTN